MGPQSDGKNTLNQHEIPELQSVRPCESKILFLAEYGYLLGGGGLCFLMGVMMSLVVVWIVLLICNRQIAVERTVAQLKITDIYAHYSMQSAAVKKPYIELAKVFNCTATKQLLSLVDNQFTDLQTQLALSYEAGMKWAQEILNAISYSGLFTAIFAAAVFMLLVEVFCITVFIVADRRLKNPDGDSAPSNAKYSFLVQGPRVIHHGVFEVTCSLSNASLQIKNLSTRAGNTVTDIFAKRSPKNTPTEVTTTVHVKQSTPPIRSPVPTPAQHPLRWQTYRPQTEDTVKDLHTSGTGTWSDLESGSVGLQTLRDHLEKRNLLVPYFKDEDTVESTVRDEQVKSFAERFSSSPKTGKTVGPRLSDINAAPALHYSQDLEGCPSDVSLALERFAQLVDKDSYNDERV